MTKLEEARQLLSKRLEELDREREQLTAAIEQLDGVAGTSTTGTRSSSRSTSRRSSKPRSSAKRSGSRKRAPRGKRESQLLTSIKAHPEFRVSDHAREVGVKPQQLYPILGRLVAKKAIVKKDDKYLIKT